MDVLVLDEADIILPRLREVLGEIQDLRVYHYAPSGGGVAAHVRESQPDVVIVSMQIPGGALDVLRSIKTGERPPVIVAISSSSSIYYRIACHDAGAAYFFDKNKDLDLLAAALVDLQEELSALVHSWPVA